MTETRKPGRVHVGRFVDPACDGKEHFASRKQAKQAARRRKGRVAYHCKACHFWHVGNHNEGKKPMKEVR